MVPAMDLIETLLFNGSMIYSSMQRKIWCWLVISTSIELSHRNRDGGNMNDITIFNEIISNLGLMEIPVKASNFTWSNMQSLPLEQIDWVFTTPNWTCDFPNILLLPMARLTPDHIPCKVQIGTSIPKAQIFRFQNFWVEYQGFYDLVKYVWSTNIWLLIVQPESLPNLNS